MKYLILYLVSASILLYIFLTGWGSESLRLVVMFILLGYVLVPAFIGAKDLWKDTSRHS